MTELVVEHGPIYLGPRGDSDPAPRRVCPDNIEKLDDDEIFVFGSNRAGRHGAGAALLARRKFGAILGQGEGLMGQSYGIPTKDANMRVLGLRAIHYNVARFIRFAIASPDHLFLVTQIGCGLAGYSPKDIAPLFGGASLIPLNVLLPQSFWKVLNGG